MASTGSRRRTLILSFLALAAVSLGIWLHQNASIERLRSEFIPWMKKLERFRDAIQEVRRAARIQTPVPGEPEGTATVRAWAWEGLSRIDGISYDAEKPEHGSGAWESSGRVVLRVDGFRPDGARVEKSVRLRVESRREGPPFLLKVTLEARMEERSESTPRFREATKEAGLGAPRNDPPFQMVNRLIDGIWPGSGAAVLDFDRDGDEDLFVADGVRSILYENDGQAHFTDVTERAGLASSAGAGIRATGVTAGDIDGDGYTDIVVTDAFGPTRVFRNQSGEAFAEITQQAGTVTNGPPRSATFADVDRDGDLDLFVCITGDYFKKMPDPPFDANDAFPNYLFLNDGKGRFQDASRAWGFAKPSRWSLTAAFADFDDDGFPDLIITNDFGLKNLYRNVNGQRFEDVTDEAGVADRGYGMSAAWGDLDGDGKLDLYTTGTYTQWGFLHRYPALPIGLPGRVFLPIAIQWMEKMCAGNSVLLQRGKPGSFEDFTAKSGAGRAGWAWSAIAADLDNDSRLDLAVTNGMWGDGSDSDRELEFWWETLAFWDDYIEGKTTFDQKRRAVHGLERDAYFQNHGDGTFSERSFLDGFDPKTNGRALIAFDANQDGALDLYVRSVQAPEALFLGTRKKDEHFLRIRFAGQGVGARVYATLPDGRLLTREAGNASGFLASGSPILHVGLGSAQRLQNLTIRWPSGQIQKLGSIEQVDRTLTVGPEKGLIPGEV